MTIIKHLEQCHRKQCKRMKSCLKLKERDLTKTEQYFLKKMLDVETKLDHSADKMRKGKIRRREVTQEASNTKKKLEEDINYLRG